MGALGTIGTAIKLSLGYEDSLGRVLAGSTGSNAKSIWNASSGKGFQKFTNFVNTSNTEVLKFDKVIERASDVFDKQTLKAVRKNSKSFKEYYNKLINLFKEEPSKETIEKFLSNNNVKSVKAPQGFFKGLWAKITKKPVQTLSKDTILENAVKNLAKDASEAVGTTAGKGFKAFFKNLGPKFSNFMKNKAGTIGIAMNVVFEIPALFKSIQNGDLGKQVGRSSLNIAGGAVGALAGAAVAALCPPIGIIGLAAGLVGGMLGCNLADKLGIALFGKSVEDQKQEAKEKQEAMVQSRAAINTYA